MTNKGRLITLINAALGDYNSRLELNNNYSDIVDSLEKIIYEYENNATHVINNINFTQEELDFLRDAFRNVLVKMIAISPHCEDLKLIKSIYYKLDAAKVMPKVELYECNKEKDNSNYYKLLFGIDPCVRPAAKVVVNNDMNDKEKLDKQIKELDECLEKFDDAYKKMESLHEKLTLTSEDIVKIINDDFDKTMTSADVGSKKKVKKK